jgi:hypothetical protein
MPDGFYDYLAYSIGYYSPAICPSSWTVAGTPSSGFGPAIEPTETARVCCPPYEFIAFFKIIAQPLSPFQIVHVWYECHSAIRL